MIRHELKNLRLDIDADGIGVALVDMPGRPFNVFSDDMIDDLAALITLIEKTPTLKAVVIASGKDAFMAGADLAMVQGFTTLRFKHTPAEIRRVFSRLTYTLRKLEKLRVPTVAAVNGLALGGGLELAMACHYRIAAQGATPCLGLPEVLLGLLPGAGGTQRLPRLTSPAFAARMLLGGQAVTPAEALEAGLVDALADPAALLASAREMARHATPGARWDRRGWRAPADLERLLDAPDSVERLLAMACTGPRVAHLYPAVGAIMQCLRDGFHRDIEAGIEVEIDSFLPLMLGPVAGNMVRTSFLSKTAAPKRAAARAGAKPADITRVAVRGLASLPPRLAKRFEVAADASAADALLAFDDAATRIIRVRALRHDTPGDGDAELRLAAPFEHADGVEIAGSDAAATAVALGIAQRLRMTPVVTTAATPGAVHTLQEAVRAYAAQHIGSASARAAAAHALDLEALFVRAGLEVAALAGYTDVDRVYGLKLLTTVALEAARLLDEGVFACAEDADVLAVFALGFPAWSGGPLSYLDMLRRGELAGAQAPATLRAAPYYSH
ncbi:MAG: enoyl-CoA hydratase/isomerase family protein [Proteobacteria bacterium]|nr:enoyl-CoA hydratase/isomerase family protein [Pseudomonadota bacterium]